MTALNSEGLDKPLCATSGCLRVATQRIEAGGVGSDHCDDCAEKIRALSALPPVDGLEVVGHVKPDHPEVVDPLFVRELSQPWMDGIFTEPVVTLSQASSVIAGLKEANEALMRERTSLIDTKREQIERLTKERDEAVDNGHDWFNVSQDRMERISSLEEENKRLREALSANLEALQAAEERDDRARFRANSPRMDAVVVHLRTSAIRSARQALENHNG